MTFPIDWTEWDKQFRAWRLAHALKRSVNRLPGKNFLADDVLGVFTMNGQTVELSEVTFPDFGTGSMETRSRYVGITWLGDDGSCVNGGLVGSFEDLDLALVAGRPVSV